MAHAYTPGLKVTEKTKIVKVRKLPLLGEVLVNENDTIKSTDIVAKTELPGKVYPINVKGELGLAKPEELPAAMLKQEGEKIEKGEVIAKTKGFFGLFSSEYKSPIEGTIQQISKMSGMVILAEPPIPVKVEGYIDGKVTKVFKDEGVEIETEGVHIQGILGLGGETYGDIVIAVKNTTDVLDADLIKSEYKDKIVVGGAKITSEALLKARDIGIKAIITGGFDYQDIRDILGKDLGVAITGHEKIGLTLVLTEGFGNIPMADRTFSLLSKYQGYKASVNGATQIRAGVLRPEIIITHNNEDASKLEKDYSETGLETGDMIRVIRAPYFGKIGKVLELPAEHHQVESGTWVRILVAEIDGERITVPRANIEVLEK